MKLAQRFFQRLAPGQILALYSAVAIFVGALLLSRVGGADGPDDAPVPFATWARSHGIDPKGGFVHGA